MRWPSCIPRSWKRLFGHLALFDSSRQAASTVSVCATPALGTFCRNRRMLGSGNRLSGARHSGGPAPQLGGENEEGSIARYALSETALGRRKFARGGAAASAAALKGDGGIRRALSVLERQRGNDGSHPLCRRANQAQLNSSLAATDVCHQGVTKTRVQVQSAERSASGARRRTGAIGLGTDRRAA